MRKTFLILLWCFGQMVYAQDTIFFENKKILPLNLRNIDLKYDRLKVPLKNDEGETYVYNYLINDIKYILTSDTNLVNWMRKQDFDLKNIMAYRKNGRVVYYEDEYQAKQLAEREKAKEERKARAKVNPENKQQSLDSSVKTKAHKYNSASFSIYKYSKKIGMSFNNTGSYKYIENEVISYNVKTSIYNSEFNFFNPSASFLKFDSKANFHEIELGNISRKVSYIKVEDLENRNSIYREVKHTNFSIGLGYTYHYVFLKDRHSRIKPMVGAKVQMVYNYEKKSSLKPSNQYVSENDFNFNTAISPGFLYQINSSAFLLFTVPISIFTHKTSILATNDNIIPENERTLVQDYSFFLYKELELSARLYKV